MSAPTPLDLYLPAGEFHFGGGNIRVLTLLGTCVAITVWHPSKRLGGICHYLLPTRGTQPSAEGISAGHYADEVMGMFGAALRASQTRPSEYIVKVAGGGNMFPAQMMTAECRSGGCPETRRAQCASVGCKNICAARALLTAAGYVIQSENVGGQGSRQLMFDLWSGDVWVKRGAAMSPGAQAAA